MPAGPAGDLAGAGPDGRDRSAFLSAADPGHCQRHRHSRGYRAARPVAGRYRDDFAAAGVRLCGRGLDRRGDGHGDGAVCAVALRVQPGRLWHFSNAENRDLPVADCTVVINCKRSSTIVGQSIDIKSCIATDVNGIQ